MKIIQLDLVAEFLGFWQNIYRKSFHAFQFAQDPGSNLSMNHLHIVEVKGIYKNEQSIHLTSVYLIFI